MTEFLVLRAAQNAESRGSYKFLGKLQLSLDNILGANNLERVETSFISQAFDKQSIQLLQRVDYIDVSGRIFN